MDDERIGPEQEALLEESLSCDDCLCWLHHCEAECCHGFNFRLKPFCNVKRVGDEVHVRTPLSPDLERYYELHGVHVRDGALILPASACDFSVGFVLRVN
jgi:hypothetical protein